MTTLAIGSSTGKPARAPTIPISEKVYVDVEISVDADLSLREAHAIAERVHDGLEHNFSNIKHVMVHVNPYEKAA